ncbi:MAG: HAD-IC family P-type ATPase [Ignavibacteria bacterium]|nr:HAD-IC family P-type ATPase [Ignavibacteria bacterium]
MNWHSEKLEKLFEYYNVDREKGLTHKQVLEHRKKFGENRLITKKPKSNWILLLEQFNNPVIIILILAAILNAFISDLKDTFVIAAVVVLNTLIGYIQERKASDALKALEKMAAPHARVIRDGIQKNIPTQEVVCGDLLILESGVRVPADGRLIESNNLLVDESMLTGESFSIEKRYDARVPENAPLGDRFTMVYSGSIVQKGRGIAVVTSVGQNTEFGKIAQKVSEAEESQSPLQIQIAKFGKALSVAILLVIAAIFVIGYLRGNEFILMFLTSVGLAVSAIPEGLPVAVTITLSIGLSQMAQHKAIVKKLAAVETLGSTNIICTDKTGTLTKNEMTVTKYLLGDDTFVVTGAGYGVKGFVVDQKTGKVIDYQYNQTLKIATYISALCTESSIKMENDQWIITGDPTEAALMIAAKKLKFDWENIKVYVDIPFESEHQLMGVRAEIGGEVLILIKGAPEKVLRRCKYSLQSDGKISNLETNLVEEQINQMSSEGLRILALAFKKSETNGFVTLDQLEELIFVGFAGIEDAIRPEAIEAVSDCHRAGIKVVMITGDHIKTAKTVAKKVGICPKNVEPFALTGVELDKMSDEELFKIAPKVDVYARVVPEHKFRIVRQLQLNNNIVAMTGDGVNDAPALKQADIGVAMGSGTDVAREAAHMVLLDDNFATIVQAVRRGRIILANLRHILLYILSTSAGGLLTIAASVLLGFPLPLLPAQLLWVNLVTDGTSTFPLAFEKEHGDVMAFPPRKKDEPLVSKGMIYRIIISAFVMALGTLGLFYYYLGGSFNPSPEILDKARTVAFCTLALFQIWNVQNSRSLDRSLFFNLKYSKTDKLDRVTFSKNLVLFAVMLLALFLQVFAVTTPFMNVVMDTVPLSFTDWLLVLLTTFSIIVIVEIHKYINSIIRYRNMISKESKKSDEIPF